MLKASENAEQQQQNDVMPQIQSGLFIVTQYYV